MRWSFVLLRQSKNIVDQYKFWQVVKSPGSSKSKQSGKRKIHHVVRLRHINTLKTQLDAEYEVMKCLASPYLSKEEEEAWHLEYGTADQQRAKLQEEEKQKRMPGVAKRVTGVVKADRMKGNIGNLLHSPRTVEHHLHHIISLDRFE
ncbi:Uncharacterized protein TPS_06261 [Trichinella pseudospiralis]